ncbi:MAG: CPBP family intramembrane metalloprotease [Planctomycetes bacterium]|nr:CPBP family intramembrane metalloprotease [Planctomycetota bacterium]
MLAFAGLTTIPITLERPVFALFDQRSQLLIGGCALVLAYLFVRTKSLLAPILFHGMANTCYAITAAALA